MCIRDRYQRRVRGPPPMSMWPCLLLCLLAAPLHAQVPAPLAVRLHAIVLASSAKYNCSVSFAVQHAEFNLSTAAGNVAAPDTPAVQASPSDKYAWGSVTKTITGAAVMKLVSEQRLGLDDPAHVYIDPLLTKEEYPYNMSQVFSAGRWAPPAPPDSNFNASDVTVRQLIGMNSGVPDYDTDAYRRLQYNHPLADFSPGDIFAVVHEPLIFKPGNAPTHGSSHKSYCSVNFILLGYLLANTAGASNWTQYDQRSILPESLRNEIDFAMSGPCRDWTNVHGIDRESSFAPYDVSDTSCLAGWTAGNVVMSSAAAARWTYALYGPDYEVLPKEYVDMMVPPEGESFYGLATFNLSGAKRTGQTGKYGVAYGHLGDTYGFTSIVSFYPALALSIAVGTNLESKVQDATNDVLCQTYNAIRTSMLGLPDAQCSYVPGSYYGGTCKCVN
eukprot:TRINITY_DN2990_c0_g1_i1.p1 TRINITY_DN2990_c0_g1~~TRINITY_DN2990_c0_g1_i1.p1  ORF type:complete len:444 (-),score=86.45 TRINITY_DN2990_c0_g1_i1:208-1539(-)